MAKSVACVHCGDLIDPSEAGNWREVRAWVQARKGGGAHQARDQQPTGRYSCRWCIDKIRAGISPGQGEML
jgi:hypothetical protein